MGSPAHRVSLHSAKPGITACPARADKLGLAPSRAGSVFWLKPRVTPRFALFHFQVIVPGARRGKQSCQTCLHPADLRRSPGASTWGPMWLPNPSSSSLPAQPRDANPLNMDLVEAECKGKRQLSPHLRQVLLRFSSTASSRGYFGRTFIAGSCSLRARFSWVLHAMSWEHPAAGE